MPAFSTVTSISPLLNQYDAFILDQFGVMHNGAHALSGAVEAVQAMVQAKKKLMILSNSSSLEKDTMLRLPKLGFDPEHFQGAVTSGQEACQYVRRHHQGQKALFLTWKEPKSPSPQQFLEQCGDIQTVTEVNQAEFVLLHGSEVLRGPWQDAAQRPQSEESLEFLETGKLEPVAEPLLQRCLERNLPIVCANPDFIYVKPDGTVGHMPGTIAKRYEQLGGNVTSFGKPNREHFEACVAKLGVAKEKVIHIGDSLHHDIAGANSAGLDSVLVMGGVHREETGAPLGELPSDTVIAELLGKYDLGEPTFVVPLLRM